MACRFGIKKRAVEFDRRSHKRTKPPDGGLSFNHCFGVREILERAKGLEPSTPTLARSCSTTELHPHPRSRQRVRRQRAPYAACRRGMQQLDEPTGQVPSQDFSAAGFSPVFTAQPAKRRPPNLNG